MKAHYSKIQYTDMKIHDNLKIHKTFHRLKMPRPLNEGCGAFLYALCNALQPLRITLDCNTIKYVQWPRFSELIMSWVGTKLLLYTH